MNAGLDQWQLAERAGCSKGHMSEIEKGSRSAKPELLKRIAQALGCDIADLRPRPEEFTFGHDPDQNYGWYWTCDCHRWRGDHYETEQAARDGAPEEHTRLTAAAEVERPDLGHADLREVS